VHLLGLAFVRKKVAMKSCQDIKNHDVKSIVGGVNERAVRCGLKILPQVYAILIIFQTLGNVRKKVAIKSCEQPGKKFDVQSIQIYVEERGVRKIFRIAAQVYALLIIVLRIHH
jgi:hypothetical protein